MRKRLVALGCFVWCGSVHAAGPVELSGLVDTYLAWDSAHPRSGAISGLTNPSLDATPSVNLILLEGKLTLGGFHAQLDVGAGSSLDSLHAPDPTLPAPSEAWKYLVQAYLGYTIPVGRGLTIDAGVMPSHIGFEVFAPRDNWNYSHAWMAELSPYYQTGVRASYPFTDHLSAQLLWLNGWGLIDQDRGFRSAGAQLAWSSDRVSAALNLFAGPPRAGGAGTRLFGDSWVSLTVTPKLKLAVALDGGVDLLATGDVTWFTGGAYVRFAPIERLAFTVRSDLVDDRDGGSVTGIGERLVEGTVTAALTLGPLEARLEGRYDHASAATLDGQTQRGLLIAALMGKF